MSKSTEVLGSNLLVDVTKMSTEIGLPATFLSDLEKQEDWSFIIKTHAFLEALISHVIAETVHRKELSEVLRRLDMAHTQYGKIIVAEKLGLIKADGKKFLLNLNRLRNDLAHDVQQINFSFDTYLKSLDKNQKSTFIKSFSYFASEDDLRNHNNLVNDLVLNYTKHAIWLSTMHFTAIIWWSKENEKLKTLALAMQRDFEAIKSS